MSVDTCKPVYADNIEPDDEIDLDGDEYAEDLDPAVAMSGYALVERKTEWYDAATGFPWVTLWTTQGNFEMPAGHLVKLKVVE